MSSVYMLHFRNPIAHAQHYVGATDNLPQRLMAHYKGNSSAIVREFHRRGISFSLAKVWDYESHDEAYQTERYIKRTYKSARKLCPTCRAAGK